MKNLTTGEVSGPPLPHDEYVEQQQQVESEDAKFRKTQRPGAAARQTAAPHHADADKHAKKKPPG